MSGKPFIEYDDGRAPNVPFDPDRSFRDAVNVAIVDAQLEGHLTVDGLRYLKDLVWSFPHPPTIDPPAKPDPDAITWHPDESPPEFVHIDVVVDAALKEARRAAEAFMRGPQPALIINDEVADFCPADAELLDRIRFALKPTPHRFVLVARTDLQELLNRCDDVPPNGDKGQTK